MESSSSRERARTPAAFRSARSRLVSSRPEEAPGTRNVSISVTVDAVPSRVSSPDCAAIRREVGFTRARARLRAVTKRESARYLLEESFPGIQRGARKMHRERARYLRSARPLISLIACLH